MRRQPTKRLGCDHCKRDVATFCSGKEPAMKSEPCVWTENDSGWWETTCQNSFVLNDGSPAENGMNFCPYCGRQLKEQVYVREE